MTLDATCPTQLDIALGQVCVLCGVYADWLLLLNNRSVLPIACKYCCTLSNAFGIMRLVAQRGGDLDTALEQVRSGNTINTCMTVPFRAQIVDAAALCFV
jgi:hypothetical protein